MSVWEDGLREQLNRQLAEQPMMSAVYSQALSNLEAGYYDERYTGALGQKFFKGSDIYEAAAFANLHTAIANGQILYTTINIGVKPTEDKQDILMAQRLDTLANLRFYSRDHDGATREELLRLRATFHGGSQADHDGQFEWTGPLEFGVKGKRKVTMLSGAFPLEVGYIPFARSLALLSRLRCLARWPYGQDDMWLFSVIDDNLWTPFAHREICKEWNPADYKQQALFAA